MNELILQLNIILERIFPPEVLNYVVLGNSVKNFLVAIGVFAGFLILFSALQSVLLRRLEKIAERTKTDIDETFLQIIRTIRPPFYSFLAFYFAVNFLNLYSFFKTAIYAVLIAWVVYQAIVAFQILINYVVRKNLVKEKYKTDQATIKTLGKLSKGILWVVGVLFILSNLGVNITSLVAGLGIGGVAIALAMQNILGDLFSSFAIFFDKPFVIGDFIVVGEHMGVVEKIGIKTTRIRSLRGEEIVVSNQELTAARVLNFKQMKERRVVFSFGVTYDTPSDKLREIPGIVKGIVQSIELARFDRAHFNKFDDSALTFEVVYYVKTSDYNKYMDTNQDIHFKIKEEFEKRDISMAFPTQTVYLHKT